MRFLTEDGIDNDDYNEVKSDLEAKIANCEKELKDCSRDLSNLVEYTDVALKIASTLGSTWDKMDFKVCQKIQNLAFPKGIKWDGEKRCYRTDGMNEFFRQIGLLRGSARGEGIKETDTDCSVSGVSSGGRTRTSGLRVMSPTSYQLLYPAILDYKDMNIFLRYKIIFEKNDHQPLLQNAFMAI